MTKLLEESLTIHCHCHFPQATKKYILKKNNQHLKRGVTISQAEAEQLQFGPDCKRSFGRF